MGKLTGTKTLANLMTAVAGEAQARSRYNTYAKYAAKAGFQQVADIFNETAANEFEHFKVFYKIIAEDQEEQGQAIMVEIGDPVYPVGLDKEGITSNLMNSAEGEREEVVAYTQAAEVATQEGFPAIAAKFKLIAGIEKQHAERYMQLATDYYDGTMFSKPEAVKWICLNCGYISEGKNAPKKCPACGYPQGYFEMFVENY